MKLLVVTSLAEHSDKVAAMLTEAGIKMFSKTETTGFKETHRPDMRDNWYGGGNGKFNSIFFFSFTSRDKAEKVIESIRVCNAEKENRFPVRGFILAVESSTYVEDLL